MISREQARVYLNSQPVIKITEKDLTSFSEPDQVLGRIISRLTHERYGNTAVIRLYTAHVSNDPAFNPWKTQEGKRLAVLLFGNIRAPFIESLWELALTLPYQNGYYRRPFRKNFTKTQSFFLISNMLKPKKSSYVSMIR